MANQDKETLNELYFKVQNVIKYAKIDKYKKDQEKIKEEGLSFWGGITGRNTLQFERLRNVKLKIELLESQKIEHKEEVTLNELMSDIQACAISELGGKFNDDMTKVYKEIKDKNSEKIADEEIYELAYQKVTKGQTYLPIIHQEKTKGIFGDIKVQIDFLKLENKNLENQIVLSRGKSQFETFSFKKQNPEIIIPVSVKMPKKCLTKR